MRKRSSLFTQFPKISLSDKLNSFDTPDEVVFAACVESNKTLQQTSLLVESISINFPSVEVILFSPREAFLLSNEDKRQWFRHKQKFVEFPIVANTSKNGFKNKVLACAWLEQNTNYKRIIFLDSDTVFLKTCPKLLEDVFDVLVKAAWFSGVALKDKSDPAAEFWDYLARSFGTQITEARIQSSIGNETMIPYFNTGCISARRNKGIFSKWLEVFEFLETDEIATQLLKVDDNSYAKFQPSYFLDQISFALAIQLTNITYSLLPKTINSPFPYFVPKGASKEEASDDIELLHYLDYFNWEEIVEYISKLSHENAKLKKLFVSRLPLLPLNGSSPETQFEDVFRGVMSNWRKTLKNGG